MLILSAQKTDDKPLNLDPKEKNKLAEFFKNCKSGYYSITIKRSRKSKSQNQLGAIFGLMIQATIEQADDMGLDTSSFLKNLIDDVPTGVALDKDFIHAIMYKISPTFDKDGNEITLSKMDTKQAARLFENFRNTVAKMGIDIPDPNPNWRQEK